MRFITADGGFCLTAKFNQMQHVTPFSVLGSAFEQYCDVLLREKDTNWGKLVVSKLQEALGQDVYYLTNVIPKLDLLLGANMSVVDCGMNSMHALNRLCYLICQFVEVVSTYSATSITLCLDDVQWADEGSILVLNQLLTKGLRKFFFIGCCRIDEMESNHSFPKMIANVRSFGANTTVVKLDCMDKDTLTEMLSDLLSLPPRKVQALGSVFFTKTIGCPLFFSQLILSLTRDGILRISMTGRRWVWEEDKIQERKLPENVAVCITNGIGKLPLDVQVALKALSLFGASAKCEHVKALQSQLNMDLIGPLNVAATEGVVNIVNGSFVFTHDRIQEAIYSNIKEEDNIRNHSLYGLCLVRTSLESGNDDMLFVAVNQINLGGSSAVVDQSEITAMAKYNLIAGKKAIALSDFSSASNFLSHGMNFVRALQGNHWVDQYSLSLQIWESAVQSALATGNTENLRTYSSEVLKHAHCLADKLMVYYFVVMSLVHSSMVAKALDTCQDILSKLGLDIPSSVSHDRLAQCTQQTQSMLKGMSEEGILNHKRMTDNNNLFIIKFLARIASLGPLVRSDLHQYVIMKMVQLSVTHGISPLSPIAFVYFGSILAKRGNTKVGYRFSVLAKKLVELLDSKEIAGEVICVMTETQTYLQPMQASKELWIQGESAAITAGDIYFACINRLQLCSTLFWTGVKLSTVNEEFYKARRFMNEQKHQTSSFIMQAQQNTILALMGGDVEDLTSILPSTSAGGTENFYQLTTLWFHQLYVSLMFNNSYRLKECAENFLELKELSLFLISGDASQVFIFGLSCYNLFRLTRDPLWAERGRKCRERMKLYSNQGSPWNFLHKFLLLEAEGHYCNGNSQSAQESYKKAIITASSHKFHNDEALSYELAANFYHAKGDSATSLEHFRIAHEKYHEWGALKKADKLFESIQKMFAGALFGNFALSSGSAFSQNGIATPVRQVSISTESAARKRREM